MEEPNVNHPTSYIHVDDTNNHYVTVTAIIEDRIKQEKGDINSIMYEISSWGGKYYVSETEIRRDNNSRFFTIATNVMYLEEE